MTTPDRRNQKRMLNLEMVNALNGEGCPACGRKFVLGDPVVLARGAWEGGSKYIHESEAVFDKKTAAYVVRRPHEAG